MAGTSQLEQQYTELRPALERCLHEVNALLTGLLGQIGGAHLMRGRLAEARVKSMQSTLHKAAAQEGEIEDALLHERVRDLVGLRIVCNNREDVYRIRDLIDATDSVSVQDEKDYIKEPHLSGYRALHLAVDYKLPVPGSPGLALPCEIQIRTLAQDTWARLSHYDLYKNAEAVPKHILRSSRRLASLLAVADDIAQDIREDVSRPLAGAEPSDGEITAEALAFLFHRTFGHEPEDYLAQAAVRECLRVGCFRLDTLDRVLQDGSVRTEMGEAYEEASGWPLDDDTLFLRAAEVAMDVSKAKEIAANCGTEERAEIEAIASSEVLSELPQDFHELVEEISDAMSGESYWERLAYDVAREFGALNHCFCSTQVIDCETFVESALEHYGLEEDPDGGALASALWNSGLECGGVDNTSMCAYHDHGMRKDD